MNAFANQPMPPSVNAFTNQLDPRTGRPIPQLQQGQAPAPTIDSQGQPWYNKLGSTLMDIAGDPRNAWIGAGPMAMARIPKAGKTAKELVEKALKHYDHEWTGKLYRAGVAEEGHHGGVYYGIDPDLASHYAHDMSTPVIEHAMPDMKNAYHIDTEKLHKLEKLVGKKFDPEEVDLGIYIEDALPGIKKKGYDSVVIHGDTGGNLSGVPIEVVDLKPKPKRVSTNEENIQNNLRSLNHWLKTADEAPDGDWKKTATYNANAIKEMLAEMGYKPPQAAKALLHQPTVETKTGKIP